MRSNSDFVLENVPSRLDQVREISMELTVEWSDTEAFDGP